MKVFRCDIRIAGTVYVKAKSKKEAKRLVDQMKGNGFEISEGEYGDVIISGASFDDPELPEVSLSPCFTLHHQWSPLEPVHEGKDD